MGLTTMNFEIKKASGSGVDGTLAEASSLINTRSKNPPKKKQLVINDAY